MYGLLCKVRVDGTGTKAQQGCKMMYFPRFAALQDDCHGGAFLRLDQMLLKGRYSKERRDRHMVFIDVTV